MASSPETSLRKRAAAATLEELELQDKAPEVAAAAEDKAPEAAATAEDKAPEVHAPAEASLRKLSLQQLREMATKMKVSKKGTKSEIRARLQARQTQACSTKGAGAAPALADERRGAQAIAHVEAEEVDGHIAESQVDKEAPVDLTSPAGWSQEGPVSRATRNLQVQVSKLEPSKRGGRRAKMADKPKPKKRAEPVCLDDSDFEISRCWLQAHAKKFAQDLHEKEDFTGNRVSFSKNSLLALQMSLEMFAQEWMTDCALLAQHGKRTTVCKSDLALSLLMRNEGWVGGKHKEIHEEVEAARAQNKKLRKSQRDCAEVKLPTVRQIEKMVFGD
ncbi:unnamed protein product [Effrenium voratum]|nr:unnamed protein product [Effrenium voratum]